MIKEEVIHMTNNRRHIEKTVAVFKKETIEFLKSKKVPILEILEWTDNAPGQYKSRNFFQRMSLMQYPITRNFFGKNMARVLPTELVLVLNLRFENSQIKKSYILNNRGSC